MNLTRRNMMTAAAAGTVALGSKTLAGEPVDDRLLELRQYKIVQGQRDAFVMLFECELIDGQEAVGMRLVGLFRDLEDPDRFTWMREFSSHEKRAKSLNDFYFGPVWQARRNEANPFLVDNDNVLLLRPATPNSGFKSSDGQEAAATAPNLVLATIHYLWKDPGEGFTAFYHDTARPLIEAAGLPVLSSYVPAKVENNFPPLPVREGEKVFVWFTLARDKQHYDEALHKLQKNKAWRDDAGPRLKDYEERAAQVLMLSPTPRSRLR
jgi:hypothetical protein